VRGRRAAEKRDEGSCSGEKSGLQDKLHTRRASPGGDTTRDQREKTSFAHALGHCTEETAENRIEDRGAGRNRRKEDAEEQERNIGERRIRTKGSGQKCKEHIRF